MEKQSKELLFEGEYNYLKKLNGKFYNPIFIDQVSGELKDGNGINIKEYKFFESKEALFFEIFEGEYKDGKKWNGIVEVFTKKEKEINPKYKYKYENGVIKFDEESESKIIFESDKGDIVNGKEYNEYGELIFEGKYKDGKRYEGIAKEYDGFVQKIFYGKYEDGKKFQGQEYNLFGDRIIFEGEFKDNKKYKGKEYNENGELIFDGEFNDEKRWNGNGYNNISKFIYKKGNIEEIEGFNGKNAIIYDYNKHELSEGEFKKCELYEGKIKTYFDDINSILKSEIEIKDGIIKGKEYYKNKRIKYIGTYKDGKFDGKGKLFYDDFGNIKYEGEFKNGEEYGNGKKYDKRGNLI